MKKISLSIIAVLLAFVSFGQTISSLPTASGKCSGCWVYVVQSGLSKKVKADSISNLIKFYVDSLDAVRAAAIATKQATLVSGTNIKTINGNSLLGAGNLSISSGGGTITSVTGTPNRITSSGGSTPVIDISSSWIGQPSITTVGTIGTGIWQGTTIGSNFGGAGTVSGILKADGSGNVSAASAGTDYSPALTFTGGVLNTSGTVTNTLISATAGSKTVIGGTAPGDVLNLQSTAGVGTSTAAGINFRVGNNGSIQSATMLNSGKVGVGTTSPDSVFQVNGGLKFITGRQGAGKVLTSDGTGGADWATAAGGTSGWALTGNAGTDTAVNFLGTTDNQMVRFRVNNTPHGLIDVPAKGNIGLGNLSLSTNGTGTFNTALGSGALKVNTTGNRNVAIGANCLLDNSTNSFNVAIGNGALAHAIADYNIAIGANTLSTNTVTGANNIAIGQSALRFSTSGGSNISIGLSSGMNISSGGENISIGVLANGTASFTGSNNIAVGKMSGQSVVTSSRNINIDYYAGNDISGGGHTLGSRNIVIGDSIYPANLNGSNTLNIGNLIFGTVLDGYAGTVSAGSIGIGIKAPAEKLDVNGNIKNSGYHFITNTSEPATPTGGGIIYVEGGALKFKGSSGTVTTIAVP